jgi:hypothetical protein
MPILSTDVPTSELQRYMADVVRTAVDTDSSPPVAVEPLSKLQVLDAVVCPVAVDVVNGLGFSQGSAKRAGHHQPMFRHCALAVPHAGERVGRREPNEDIASCPHSTATFPAWVSRTTYAPSSLYPELVESRANRPWIDCVSSSKFHSVLALPPTSRDLLLGKVNALRGVAKFLGAHFSTLTANDIHDCRRMASPRRCYVFGAITALVKRRDLLLLLRRKKCAWRVRTLPSTTARVWGV